ncbi:ABC transporter ATP-binding protein [Paenibacillus sp. GCM10012306]|uniref:ABC transporter ATP-binding protein n=1 Tax=Paenibacillus sp. GCM10012306 TaxID=3317342 RepID=UPI00360E11E3
MEKDDSIVEAIMECQSLTKRYDNHTALNNINVTVGKGRIVGLLGPNGSGKTTLLKMINGLLVPSNGEVIIKGMRPGIESKRIVSYLPERNCLNNWMKVKELVAYYSDFYADFSREKASDLMKDLNINMESRLKTLSKGTKEKIQLILVMSRDADLYCLDEPIGGVDPASRDYIIDTILKCYNRRASILISTHLISDIEHILDDVIFIDNGCILQAATAEEIRTGNGVTVDQYFRRIYAKKTDQI